MKKVTEINQTVGSAINNALSNKKMTQTELAKCVGSTQRSISSYVTGYTQPPLDILCNICIKLEMNLNQILNIPEYPFPYRTVKEKEEMEYAALLEGLSPKDKIVFIHAVKEIRKLIKPTDAL